MEEDGILRLTLPQADPEAARLRLVRFCARFTGDRHLAEDLAQETLIAAWRNSHTLRNPAVYERWLLGIARNFCRRWRQHAHREVCKRPLDDGDHERRTAAQHAAAIADSDLERDLERDELATLLDRALAALPADTRAALIAHHLDEMPQAEIAARLRVSEGAVAVRLHRGRIALRRVLTTELAQEAAAYGIAIPKSATWQELRLWCPNCGQRRCLGRFDAATGELWLRCPACRPEPDIAFDYVRSAALFAGVGGFAAAYTRLMRWVHRHHRPGLARGTVPCLRCGRALTVATAFVPNALFPAGTPPMYCLQASCSACGVTQQQSLSGLALALPAGRRFWREERRIRRLPEREVEAAGCAALVSSFESLTSAARLDVVSARDTFALLGAHGAPEA